MAKDVNIHIKTPGAPQAKQQLDEIGRSAKQVGSRVDNSSKKGAGSMQDLSAATKKTKTNFKDLLASTAAWVAKAVGIAAVIGGITAAIREQSRAMEEHARIAREQQEGLLRLQQLGGLFEERPELRKEVTALAEYGRRPFEEVADAWYNLRSKGAGLSRQQRDSIMREALELGRTDPSARLDTLIDMFSLYAKQTGLQDANRIQNVMLQTITEAGGGTGDVAKYMPQFLPIGISGGLSGAQAAGLWSYVTTQLAEPSIATTGLKAVFMGLQGRGSPEGQKMLAQLGISPEMDFFSKIRALSGQFRGGKFGLGQAEQIAGREGAAVLLSMLKSPGAMMRTISAVEAADVGGVDITRDRIMGLMGQDEFATTEEYLRQLEIAIENVKGGDLNALNWLKVIRELELSMLRRGDPPWIRGFKRKVLKGFRGVGVPSDFAEDYLTPLSPEERELKRNTGTMIINDHSMNYFPTVGSDERGPRFQD